MSKTFEILPFTKPFTDSVIELIVQIQQNEFNIPITASDQPDLMDIPGFYQQGCGNFWVAVTDREIVGSISLKDIGNCQAALRKMFVRKDFRGSDSGTARALLSCALEWSRDRGIIDIFLGTTEKFLAAHRFYEKNGFVSMEKGALPASFPVMAVDTKFYGFHNPPADTGPATELTAKRS